MIIFCFAGGVAGMYVYIFLLIIQSFFIIHMNNICSFQKENSNEHLNNIYICIYFFLNLTRILHLKNN